MKTNYQEAPLGAFHLRLYIAIILGQIACGYALGIAGTAVTQAQAELGLSTFWVGLLGAGTLIGLGGSFVIGNLSDKLGRSRLLVLGMVLFSILSILQYFTSNVVLLLILRIGLGLCIAIDYTVGSTIISEWLPRDKSSIYLSRFIIFWTSGFVASFFAGLLMSNLQVDFHLILVSSALPGILAAGVRIIGGVAESPIWLASVGRKEEAQALVQDHLGPEYGVFQDPSLGQEQEEVSVSELFQPEYIKNTIVGGTFYACQVFPFFGVSIFLPILVDQMNMGSPNASSILYDIFCLAGAFVGTYYFNRVSRRFFLTSTFYVSGAALLIMILFRNGPMAVTLIAFSVFALTMSVSTVIENPYPPELFNDRMRGAGVGVVVAISRVGAAAGTFLLPILVESIGIYGALGVCMAILFVGGVVCQLWAPETSLNHQEEEKLSPVSVKTNI